MSLDAINIIFEELSDLKDRIISNIDSTGRSSSGNTASSLHVEKANKNVSLLGRKAFGTLETGRKAGKVPYNFTSIIAKWVQDKGISYPTIPYKRIPSEKWQPKYTPDERGLMSISGAIAHKIVTEGTTLYRQGGSDNVYSQEIPETIQAIKDRIGFMVRTEIVESIKLNN